MSENKNKFKYLALFIIFSLSFKAYRLFISNNNYGNSLENIEKQERNEYLRDSKRCRDIFYSAKWGFNQDEVQWGKPYQRYFRESGNLYEIVGSSANCTIKKIPFNKKQKSGNCLIELIFNPDNYSVNETQYVEKGGSLMKLVRIRYCKEWRWGAVSTQSFPTLRRKQYLP